MVCCFSIKQGNYGGLQVFLPEHNGYVCENGILAIFNPMAQHASIAPVE